MLGSRQLYICQSHTMPIKGLGRKNNNSYTKGCFFKNIAININTGKREIYAQKAVLRSFLSLILPYTHTQMIFKNIIFFKLLNSLANSLNNSFYKINLKINGKNCHVID